jgi:hypothetical protein
MLEVDAPPQAGRDPLDVWRVDSQPQLVFLRDRAITPALS